MKIVLQRVSKAQCFVDGQLISSIKHGYVLLVGFTKGDNELILEKAVKKIINLRVFEDENKKMNLDIKQVKGSILSISQFTLYADTKKGNRPSFKEALNPYDAKILYKSFNQKLRQYLNVVEGVFGEHMEIKLINDGPVTIILNY